MEQNGKILVVDDVEAGRALLKEILSPEYQFLEADGGQEALRLLEERRGEIALVLLSLTMLGMDGYEVLSAMGERGWLDGLPVIAVSSGDPSVSLGRAYDLGAMESVVRPLDRDVVRRRVENTILLCSRFQPAQLAAQERHPSAPIPARAAGRTLSLLTREWKKCLFFASVSHEVQFEYNEKTGVLTLSKWGAEHLGVEQTIPDPTKDQRLLAVVTQRNMDDLCARLGRATPEAPLVSQAYCLRVRGKPCWYKVVAQPLWADERTGERACVVGKCFDIHSERVKLAAFKRMAQEDSLTGLLNFASARRRITAELAAGHEKLYAFVLFDLDYFKGVNDKYGHQFGNEILIHTARLVSQNVRSRDVAARVGGDEFLIFAEYQQDIEMLMKRVIHLLTGRYKGYPISVSMGVALVPRDGSDYDTLFYKADRALYAAKEDGRKRYRFYDASLPDFPAVISAKDGGGERPRRAIKASVPKEPEQEEKG